MTTATEMRPRARTVWRLRGMPSTGTLSTAVTTSSRALANAFNIEFNFLRNKLVTIPRTELLIISSSTRGCLMESNAGRVKALEISPCNIM